LITKSLHVFSVHGAAVTIIDGVPAGSPYSANVMVLTDGVAFGGRGAGFTIFATVAFGISPLQ
jgi:hypothetical protein